MSSGKNYVRDYSANGEGKYAKKTVKDRSSRVQARRIAIQKWGKKAVQGKDVGHRDGNPKNNKPSNLILQTPKKNRSYKRTKTAGKKNKGD